ncbi:heme oxygenase (biliverdin-producing) [Gryllotalpicola reticulitermitis]|uniref:Heme oxygenase (Biliverdin-producing) n=1 Tax=Gryllotalpicola reticulitermitis TaxID=1184153 RepID=A0ABV8Q900_9MICO
MIETPEHRLPAAPSADHADQPAQSDQPPISAAPSFSAALRDGTAQDHSRSERSEFITQLLSGNRSRDDYIALVAQHYFIYAALERAAELLASEPVVTEFLSPELTRLPAIESDLAFLLGDAWRERIAPLESTRSYAARIRSVASDWPAGFVAHHYTRYLGDLSGGQIVRTLMQRSFGFEERGVGFYRFDGIAKPRAFRNTYHARLDAAPWSPEERRLVIDEARLAYRFNTEVFDELGAAPAV